MESIRNVYMRSMRKGEVEVSSKLKQLLYSIRRRLPLEQLRGSSRCSGFWSDLPNAREIRRANGQPEVLRRLRVLCAVEVLCIA